MKRKRLFLIPAFFGLLLFFLAFLKFFNYAALFGINYENFNTVELSDDIDVDIDISPTGYRLTIGNTIAIPNNDYKIIIAVSKHGHENTVDLDRIALKKISLAHGKNEIDLFDYFDKIYSLEKHDYLGNDEFLINRTLAFSRENATEYYVISFNEIKNLWRRKIILKLQLEVENSKGSRIIEK